MRRQTAQDEQKEEGEYLPAVDLTLERTTAELLDAESVPFLSAQELWKLLVATALAGRWFSLVFGQLSVSVLELNL